MKDIISRLREGDQQVLKDIYLENRTPFLKYVSRFNVPSDQLEDIYQDAIIALNEKVVSGKLEELTCSIRTYIFSIGKYMVYDLSRKNQKTVVTDEDYVFDTADFDVIETVKDKSHLNNQQQQLMANFKSLGKKCQEVLNLFYYSGFTIDEIVGIQGYASKNAVKAQKSRCLKSLKELIHNTND